MKDAFLIKVKLQQVLLREGMAAARVAEIINEAFSVTKVEKNVTPSAIRMRRKRSKEREAKVQFTLSALNGIDLKRGAL